LSYEHSQIMPVGELHSPRGQHGLERLLDGLLGVLCELPDYVEVGCGCGSGAGDRGLGVGIILGV
jgi:hypothetical protein